MATLRLTLSKVKSPQLELYKSFHKSGCDLLYTCIWMHMQSLHAYVFMYMCMDIFNNVFSSESTALYITLTKYKNCCLCSSLGAIHIRDPLLSKLVTITNFGQHTPVTYSVLMIIVCLHLPDCAYDAKNIYHWYDSMPIPNIQDMIISNLWSHYAVKNFMPICTNRG